jgi:cell division protease FtsH
LILGVGFLGVLGLTLYRVTTGRIPALESKTREADKESSTVTFEDVAGVDEAKEEVKEIVDFLREPERFSDIGGRIPKGVLLVGPPGHRQDAAGAVDRRRGQGAVPFRQRIGFRRDVRRRRGVAHSQAVQRRTPSPGVHHLHRRARTRSAAVAAATRSAMKSANRRSTSCSSKWMASRPTRASSSLPPPTGQTSSIRRCCRPGRFDRQVTVGAPDLKGREQILKIHAKKVALEPEVDLRQIARGTPGFSGAELANLVNEAALYAVRNGRRTITDGDFDHARDKVLMGVERKSLTMSQEERVTCAYHESGHAVVAALLPHADPLHKVTIIPRGRALGVTMQLPEGDRHTIHANSSRRRLRS